MRTNLTIDDRLMRHAMRMTGLPIQKAVIEEGLRLFIKVNGQGAVRRLKGKVSLAQMCASRTTEGIVHDNSNISTKPQSSSRRHCSSGAVYRQDSSAQCRADSRLQLQDGR